MIWLYSIYILVPKENEAKPSGKKGIFVNYSETSKAYRSHTPRLKKIEVSHDVTFGEACSRRKRGQIQG